MKVRIGFVSIILLTNRLNQKNLLGDANNYFLCTTFINILILKECVSLLHENKIAG